jgi:hypothetical protein
VDKKKTHDDGDSFKYVNSNISYIYDKNGGLAEEKMFNDKLKTTFIYNSTGLLTKISHGKIDAGLISANPLLTFHRKAETITRSSLYILLQKKSGTIDWYTYRID